MTPEEITSIGKIGSAAALGLSAIGSALGAGVAGMAAIGSWKKCYAQNKLAPFMLISFVGAPLTQTLYGFIMMNSIRDAAVAGSPWQGLVGAGILGGLAVGLSAFMQGKAAAAASDALGETGQGTANYLIALGIIETVAIFTLVFINNAIK
ncbi:MAG: V-type ATP synthase subunit K [Kiritimatiellia bacterium]